MQLQAVKGLVPVACMLYLLALHVKDACFMSQTHAHGKTTVGIKMSITLQAAHASAAANQPPARQPPAGQLPASEPPALQPAPAQTPSQPLLPPGTSSAAITGPASGPTPQGDSPALSAQAQPGSSDVKKSDSTPAEAAGPQGGSPKAEEGVGSPSKQVKMMSGILEVLAREVLNPASTKETRDAAHTCLQVLCFCHEVVSRKHADGDYAKHCLCWICTSQCCVCGLFTAAVPSFKCSLLAFCLTVHYRLCIKQMQCKDVSFLSLH